MVFDRRGGDSGVYLVGESLSVDVRTGCAAFCGTHNDDREQDRDDIRDHVS